MTIHLSENIRKLRREKELTQETLAEFLGVTFQSVSKWERGESYPDITMLPAISSFFGVTTDELLGVDKVKKEEQIQKHIEEFEFFYFKDTSKALKLIGAAVKEFPGDFRLLIRYMTALVSTKGGIHDNPIAILDEMVSINESIQNHCTSDNIRIRAKRLISTYYLTLSQTEKDESYIDKIERIIEDLPAMRDSRDYMAARMYPPGEKHDTVCKTAIEEILFLLDDTIAHYCYYDDRFPAEYKIDVISTVLSVQNSIYTDGNYGKSWSMVVFNHGHLGYLYFIAGDRNRAVENLRKCAELSVKYDSLPIETVLESPVLKGLPLKKPEHDKTMCERMKRHFLHNYPLSDEFKASNEFKQIIDMLG